MIELSNGDLQILIQLLNNASIKVKDIKVIQLLMDKLLKGLPKIDDKLIEKETENGKIK